MNRRMGGGPRGGNNRSFQQAFHSGGGGGGGGGLNPWQGGGSNMNQGGILSQLTSNPQLALALTSLLAPQQQQPPSLLSLNTSPAFSNNRDYGRFNSGFNRGREIRRHEPYNKNRGGGFGGDRRRRSPPRRDNIRKNDNRNDNKKTEKKNEKKKDDDTAEDGADDEKKETKRDWKDEKNQAEGKDSGDEAEAGSTTKKDGTESKDGKYVGVPSRYLHCFVCNKQMWDGESMQKHVRGRAHHEMLKALEESIQICVNILRENLRLAEDRKMIEYNRQGRQRKFQRREAPLSHCSMCDLKFMGKIISHRRTDGHQRLKRYLHPSCRICSKEYPSRIEWIEHCLTPEHLKRSSESTESRSGGKDGDDIMEPGAEEDIMDDPNRLEPLLEEPLHMEADDPIIEVDSSLESMAGRLPAYRKERPVAAGSMKEFSGFKCDLCNRSFVDKEDADGHLTTKRHFYRFIDFIKERFDREEKQKKAEKEAADKKKKEDAAKAKEEVKEEKEGEEEAEEEVEEEAEGDQEMYDPAETTEETAKAANGDAEEEEEEESEEPVAENKMEVVEEAVEEEEEPEPEPEPKPEPKKEEVKKEAPPTPKPATRKSLAGPKSRRGKK